jgi:hypothetical protein
MEDVRLATTVRAVLAVALLAGFYAFGFALLAFGGFVDQPRYARRDFAP